MKWEGDVYLDEILGTDDFCPGDPEGKDMTVINRDDIPRDHLGKPNKNIDYTERWLIGVVRGSKFQSETRQGRWVAVWEASKSAVSKGTSGSDQGAFFGSWPMKIKAAFSSQGLPVTPATK